MGRQRCRRLVHDQTGLEGDRLGDLDACWAPTVSVLAAPRIEVDVEGSQDVAGLVVIAASARAGPAAMADEDVLGDAEVREDHRLLVDRDDAATLSVGGRARWTARRRCASRRRRAGGSRHRLDQRRLAGAVLADEGVDLAGVESIPAPSSAHVAPNCFETSASTITGRRARGGVRGRPSGGQWREKKRHRKRRRSHPHSRAFPPGPGRGT